MHIAEQDGDKLLYRGKVRTGFDDATIKEISGQIKSLQETKKPIVQKVLDEKTSTWIEPKLIAEISYSMLTADKMYHELVFVRMRPDLS